MERHQGGMNGHRDDRKVEVVKHDINMLVDASLKAKVQTKCATTDVLQRGRVIGPGDIKKEGLVYNLNLDHFTHSNTRAIYQHLRVIAICEVQI